MHALNPARIPLVYSYASVNNYNPPVDSTSRRGILGDFGIIKSPIIIIGVTSLVTHTHIHTYTHTSMNRVLDNLGTN